MNKPKRKEIFGGGQDGTSIQILKQGTNGKL